MQANPPKVEEFVMSTNNHTIFELASNDPALNIFGSFLNHTSPAVQLVCGVIHDVNLHQVVHIHKHMVLPVNYCEVCLIETNQGLPVKDSEAFRYSYLNLRHPVIALRYILLLFRFTLVDSLTSVT